MNVAKVAAQSVLAVFAGVAVYGSLRHCRKIEQEMTTEPKPDAEPEPEPETDPETETDNTETTDDEPSPEVDPMPIWCECDTTQKIMERNGALVRDTPDAVVITPSAAGIDPRTTAAYGLLAYSQRNAGLKQAKITLDWLPLHYESPMKSHPRVNSTAVFRAPQIWQPLCAQLLDTVTTHAPGVTCIVAFETSRAMAFGLSVALQLKCAFVPARRAASAIGRQLVQAGPDTERVAIDKSAFPEFGPNQVVIVDDVVSTGATLASLVALLREEVAVNVLCCVTLVNYSGQHAISGVPLHCVI